MFSPATYPMGSVFLEFSTSDSPESSKQLAPFELYRRSLIVLGIADGAQTINTDTESRDSDIEPHSLSVELEDLKEEHASALVYKILVFDGSIEEDKHAKGIIHVPKQDKSPSTILKTIVCDIVAEFLEELSFYARSIQALPNIETPVAQPLQLIDEVRPGSGNRTIQSPISGTSSPTTNPRDNTRSPYRASMPAHVLSPLSAELHSGVSSTNLASPAEDLKPATTFDDIAVGRPSSASSNSHMRQISVQGFGSGTSSERVRNQAKGRIGIVVGSMYLLAGRWSEAVKELTDSANTAKWSSDHAWFAKALDNILTGLLMCGWAGIEVDIPQICYPGEKPPWSFRSTKQVEGNRVAVLRILSQLLPDLTHQILYYYGRAASSNSTEKSAVPMLTYSESALRFARLLSILRAHYSVLNEQTFQNIISNIALSSVAIPDTIDSLATKAEIASIVLRAAPARGGDDMLDPLDHLAILAGTSSVLSSLGYHRKKAFVLREFIIILLPLLVRNRKDSAAELGFHPAASLSSADLAAESVYAPTVTQKLGTDEEDILSLLDSVCNVYGVISAQGSGSEKLDDVLTNEKSLDMHLEGILSLAKKRHYGNIILKMDVLRWCINICEALPDLSGMLRYSSDLLTTASTGLAPGPESSDAYPIMPVEDQTRTVNTIVRAAGASKELSIDNQEAEYWDNFLVRDIEILPLSTSNPPIPRRKQDLLAAGGTKTEKKVGPFIYNPFATKAPAVTHEPTLLLERETTFLVLLQNLFDVGLDIEWLKLETSTNSIETIVRGVTVGPYRTQKVYLKGYPKVAGHTKILGCTVKIRGCKAKAYPIFKSAWRPTDELKLKELGIDAAKRRPLSSDVSKDLLSKKDRPIPVTFPLNIIEDQPLVLLKSTTLTQSAIMVLVGQTRRFQIVLENTSEKEIDFVLVSFTDSTSDLLRAAVDNKETSSSDLYEAEYSAYHQPALKLVERQSDELVIKPKGRITLEVEVFGKPGLYNGSVQISYSHLGVPRDQIGDKFYTRQIIVPVVVTVNASVELVRTEILPYSNVIVSSKLSQSQPGTPGFMLDSTIPPKRRLDNVLDELKRQHLGDDRCFLLLDFFNAWPRPLRMALEANEEEQPPEHWKTAYEVEDIVQPGTSTRLLMIIPKVSITDPQSPIPTLNPANRRQFILSANNKATIESSTQTRQLFWYREAILQNLRATWSELGSSTGVINLRTMRLNPTTIPLLNRDLVDIHMSLTSDESPIQEPPSSSHYTLHKNTFAKLTIRIRNRSLLPITPILRLQPSLRHQTYNLALDLSRKVAFNGLLQRVLPVLQGGATYEANLGCTFLCSGEYEIGACLEEVVRCRGRVEGGGIGGTGDGDGDGDGGGDGGSGDNVEERRVWFCKRACAVDVR